MIQLGLVGWPVTHSLSPILHQAALASTGLKGEYCLYPVDPAQPEALKSLLIKVRSGEISGLNVTIPHKQEVIKYMDEMTLAAQQIGAVNTVSMQNGRLTGDNTDSPGFLVDLQKACGNTDSRLRKAIILGAGGSARAVVSALSGSFCDVTIASRRSEQAQNLADYFNRIGCNHHIHYAALTAKSLKTHIIDTSLVVNTTPVGMVPDQEHSPWPEGLPWPKDAFIYDLVYNPWETLLVKQAKEAGLQAVNGLGMLVEQAALAFEIWTRRIPSRELMYSAVRQVQLAS
jgi:shikimate dehydrogenase